MAATMANKYAGECARCGGDVPAGEGVAIGEAVGRQYRGGRWHVVRRWRVEHVPARWHGSPVSGGWVGGCPAPEGDPATPSA